MRLEGQQAGQPAIAFRRFHRPGDDRLMAEVHAIEDSEREMQRLTEIGQFFEAMADQHAAAISSAAPPSKPGF